MTPQRNSSTGPSASRSRRCRARRAPPASLARPAALLAATLLALLAPACFTDFDLSDRDVCISSADCIDGRVCVRGEGSYGRCADPRLPEPTAEDTTPSRPGPTPTTRTETPPTGSPTNPTLSPPTGTPCEELSADQLRTDPRNCGACGNACDLPNATARCDDGTCTVDRCDPGFANTSGDPTAGCTSPCDDGNLHCRDWLDDDCSSPAGRRWTACDNATPLADRRFAIVLWDARQTWGEINRGRVTMIDSRTARMENMVAGNILLDGRGRALSASEWDVVRATGRTVELHAASGLATRFVLHEAPGATRLLAGPELDGDTPTGRWAILLETAVTPSRITGLPPHRTLILAPPAEGSPVPGGTDLLGWNRAAQLPLFAYGNTTFGSEEELHVPFIEYRDGYVGSANNTDTVVPLSWRLTADGTLRVLRPGTGFNAGFDKVIEGVATPDGGFSFSVARWTSGNCPSAMQRVANECVPDPVPMAGIAQHVPPLESLAGHWRLTGLLWQPRIATGGERLAQTLIDTEITIDGTLVLGHQLIGRIETTNEPTIGQDVLRIELSGDAAETFNRDLLVLEGHVAPGSRIGLLWDRTPTPNNGRPLHGGFLLLLRQPDTP